jgi:hypothetical protein
MLHDAARSKDEAPASFRRMLTTIPLLGHTTDLPVLYNGHYDIVHALDTRMKSTPKRATHAHVLRAPTRFH